MDWAEQEFKLVDFRDQRLVRRAQQLLSRLGDKPTINIPAACSGWSETKATYRLLDNGRMTSGKLLAPHRACTLARVEGEKTVLCIEDTSELYKGSRPSMAELTSLAPQSQRRSAT